MFPFSKFTPARIDHNRAIVFDAVSLRHSENAPQDQKQRTEKSGIEVVWRRVAFEADVHTANLRLFDADKKIFLGSRFDLAKSPSMKPSGIDHLRGLTLGKGKPTIDQWEYFLSFWLEKRPLPITILAKTGQDLQDVARILCFIQAYKLRLLEEYATVQRVTELCTKAVARSSTHGYQSQATEAAEENAEPEVWDDES